MTNIGGPTQVDDLVYSCVTDAAGEFRLGPIPQGRWQARLEGRRRIRGERELLVGGDREVWAEFVAESPLQRISGVVEAPGESEVSKEASVGATFADGARLELPVAAGGKFLVKRFSGDSPGPVTLQARCEGFESADPIVAEWGARNVVLRLRRGLAVRLVVTKASTGAPVEDYGVRWFRRSKEATSYRAMQLRKFGRHADGECTVPGLAPGDWCFVVEPAESSLAPSEVREAEVREWGQVVSIEVAVRVVRSVVVRDRRGSPVRGSDVTVFRAWPKTLPTTSTVVSRRPMLLGLLQGAGIEEDRGKTGGDGACALRCSASGMVAVLVTGRDHAPAIVTNVEWGSGVDPVLVNVRQGACILGSISPRQVFGGGATRVWLRNRRETGTVFPLAGHGVRVDRMGKFAMRSVPAGDWDLIVGATCLGEPYRVVVSGLRDGESRHVNIDRSDVRSAVLEGVATVDGVALDGRVSLVPENDAPWANTGNGRFPSLRVRNGGKYRIVAAPGRYRMMAYRSEDGPLRRFVSSKVVSLQGGVQVCNIDFRDGRGDFRVVGREQAVPYGEVVAVVSWVSGGAIVGRVVPDPLGRFTLDPLPSSDFNIEIRRGEKVRRFGPFEPRVVGSCGDVVCLGVPW